MRQPGIHNFRHTRHGVGMGKKKKLQPTFIREWRKYRSLTLEQLSSRIGMTTSNLSKTERGDQAYTQPVLEALAEALACSPADLIMRPPGARTDLQALLESLEGDVHDQAVAVIKALKGRSKAA